MVNRRGLLDGTSSKAGGGTSIRSGGGGGGGGLSSLLPLSDEARDVRAGELMSFGVDLPYDMLLILLRLVWPQFNCLLVHLYVFEFLVHDLSFLVR